MADISGLTYLADYLDADRERELLGVIDAQPWLADLKRRVQHYGYKYDYRARAVDASMHLGPLPPWAAALGAELTARGLMPRVPDQLIVNEYEPGQGIAPHVDCEPVRLAARHRGPQVRHVGRRPNPARAPGLSDVQERAAGLIRGLEKVLDRS